MISTILHIYLAGWLGTSGYGVYSCTQEKKMHGGLSQSECIVVVSVAGAAWPYFGYKMIKGDL